MSVILKKMVSAQAADTIVNHHAIVNLLRRVNLLLRSILVRQGPLEGKNTPLKKRKNSPGKKKEIVAGNQKQGPSEGSIVQ